MSIKVAIVEDSATIVRQLENYVKYDNSFDLIGKYEDAQSAIDLIPFDKPDIVIMDIGLPGEKNGLQCVLELKLLFPDMKFLMYTASDEDRKLLDAIELGAKGYVLKTEDITKIPGYVRTIMEGGAYMTSRMLKLWMDIRERSNLQKPEEFARLKDEDNRIIKLVAAGKSDKEIATNIGTSHGAIRTRLNKIRNQLNTETRYSLIVMYWKHFGGPV